MSSVMDWGVVPLKIDLSPDVVKLKLYEGDRRTFEITYENEETGTPIDVTGYSFELKIKRSDANKATVKILTSPSNITVTGTAHNIITFRLGTDFGVGEFVGDIKMTTTTGEIITSPRLAITIQRDI